MGGSAIASRSEDGKVSSWDGSTSIGITVLGLKMPKVRTLKNHRRPSSDPHRCQILHFWGPHRCLIEWFPFTLVSGRPFSCGPHRPLIEKWFNPLIGMDELKYEEPHRTLIADFSFCLNWEDLRNKCPHRSLIDLSGLDLIAPSSHMC